MIAAELSLPSVKSNIFTTLEVQPPDALLALIKMYAADPRPTKIDLGVGVYRNEQGETPVMHAVKAAEARLLAEQKTKSYLGAEGDARFTELLGQVVFGDEIASSDRLTGVQTPGGTGALRLGAELIARAFPGADVWIGTPTWPNHAPIFREAGLTTTSHRFYDPSASAIDFNGMLADLSGAASGDILLLHGCCHNPTGEGFTLDQWRLLADHIVETGLVPFVDLAYQGLGDGLDEDAAGLRHLLSKVPAALIAYSCDKNFGLYRERVGALWVLAADNRDVKPVRDNMLVLARSLWSMPPDHGAGIVRTILENDVLRADWQNELTVMRERTNSLRDALARTYPQLGRIAAQRGMFAMLPIERSTVVALREEHGIYMAESGRINVVGLRNDTIPILAAALAPYLNV